MYKATLDNDKNRERKCHAPFSNTVLELTEAWYNYVKELSGICVHELFIAGSKRFNTHSIVHTYRARPGSMMKLDLLSTV